MKIPWFFLFLQILQGSVLLWRAQDIVGPQSLYGLLYWTLTLAVFVCHGFLSEKDVKYSATVAWLRVVRKQLSNI